MDFKRVGFLSSLAFAQIVHEAEAAAAVLHDADSSTNSAHVHEELTVDSPRATREGQHVTPIVTLELLTHRPPSDDEGILLASIPIGDDAIGVRSVGTAIEGTILASGTANGFRMKNTDGETVFQGAVTDMDGDGDIKFANRTIVVGGVVAIVPSRQWVR